MTLIPSLQLAGHPAQRAKAPNPNFSIASLTPDSQLIPGPSLRSYVGISLNELYGLELHCTPKQLNAAGQCPITKGQQTIDQLGLDYLNIPQCVGILISYIVICRFIAYLGVRFLKH